MKSIKAILAGTLFIIITIVMIQLAIVFLTVGYNILAKDYPFLHGISIYFRYLVAYPVLLLVLFVGGYLTAKLSQKQVLAHCLAVGVITVSLSTVTALDYMVMTVTGMVLVMLALLSIMAGGWYWQKKNNT
ncbi:MAG: hypothetical protein OEY52_11855 [Gammaproteobacteria bacterium]|nr:hypothetical protein [Gammaproteobacteria bacterium]